METSPRRFEARDYARIVIKRLGLTALVFIGTVLAGGLYSLSAPQLYTASSLIRVKTNPPGFFWVSGESPAVPDMISLETQAKLATTSEVAQRAAQLLEKEPSEAKRVHASAAEILGSLKSQVIEPDLIRIHATHSERRKAIAFANAGAEAFCQLDEEARRASIRAGREYIESELKRAEHAYEQAELRIAQFQEETGLLTLPGEDGGGTPNLLAQYENERRAAEAAAEEAEAQLAELERLYAAEPTEETESTYSMNPVLSALRSELAARQVELAELRSKYTDEHPDVMAAQERVAALQKRIDDFEEPVVSVDAPQRNPFSTALRTQILQAQVAVRQARARVTALNHVIATYREDYRDLPEKQRRIRRLQDQARMARETFLALLTSQRDALIDEHMKKGLASVVDRATTATRVGPQLLRTLIFSAVIGVLLGVGLAFLLEIMDNTVRTPEDVTRDLGIPFLGIVPLIEGGRDELVTLASPKSPPAEAYRTLRSNINFATVDTPVTSVLITSAGAAEGKTCTTANLAVVMAQSGQSVLLVDTDLRRPKLHRYFDLDASRGLTNVLVGDFDYADVLQETGIPGLKLLASGPLPPNPAELLDSERMAQLLTHLGESFDIVLLDSPPAIVLTDACVLAAKVDTVVFVLEAGKVTREAGREMRRLIENARGAILGGVLNKLRLTGSDYYYYYYYYYDYGRTGRRRRSR